MSIKIPRNFNSPELLPDQLIIKKGLVVEIETGKVPRFPKDLEGMHVNVVPHDDAVHILTKNRKLWGIISELKRVLDRFHPKDYP